jgi:chromate transporter
MDWLTYFLLFLKASLFSTGGRGPFPYLYTDLISRGWAREVQFAEALTVGEMSPGPSGLWVVSLGYLTGGFTGALLATIAVALPPFTVLLVMRVHERLKHFRATRGVLDGLVLAIVGSSAVVLVQLFASNGVSVTTVAIAVATAAAVFHGKVPSIVLLAAAGLAGAVLLS